MYRLKAKLMGIWRFMRFVTCRGKVQYKAYGSGVPGWYGWFELNGSAIAFLNDSGKTVFCW